jgi:hypothetical protein
MSTVARKIKSTPTRSASATWRVIVNLLSKSGSAGRIELEKVLGIADSLIADECFKGAAAIVSGSGPRIKIYCLYDEEAITGDKANENSLNFNATEGDWKMSLPCEPEDLEWVQKKLKEKSTRITARDMNSDEIEDVNQNNGSKRLEIDGEGFLNS